MSLLDHHLPETVIVYQEEVVTDIDGNVRTRPSSTGVSVRASLQPQGQSGTSSRRAEQDNEGFESERVYSLRLPRDYPLLGMQAQIEWRGKRWALFGTEVIFNQSRRTQHVVYTIKRY